MGKNGRGVHEYCGVMDRVDIITSTFGKALGGASGGFTSGRKEIIDMLRQRSRPYLFSNTVATVLENKYGLDRCLSISIISFRPDVNPPEAPPSALPKVLVIISTRSITPQYSWTPLPFLPIKLYG